MNATTNTTTNFEILANNKCQNTIKELHPSFFGVHLAVPEWEAIITILILSIIIMLTIVGNILVILSVFTYKPLRIVQNFFIVSLAIADLTVAVLVLPFNVAYSILGRWEFGINLCKMWLTCDVMCCTSSILNLCIIALDRYWAITDPINYAQKRNVGRVLLLIAGVWILSLLISSPPLIGWNDWPQEFSSDYPCQLTSNQGYVIYSSLGSFYIPLIIMTIVYIEIYIATKRRLRERARATRVHAINLKNAFDKETHINTQQEQQQNDQESISSESNHNDQSLKRNVNKEKNFRKKLRAPKQDSLKIERAKQQSERLLQSIATEESITENPETSLENTKQSGNESFARTNSRTNVIPPCDRSSSKKLSTKKSSGIHQFIEEKQKISLSKERKAARTLGIIMGVFVVCWLPFFLMYVILPFCPSCCPTNKFTNFITWLGYINSCLNPVIYTIFNLDYRKAFKKLLGIK